jgi:hypothetical protein
VVRRSSAAFLFASLALVVVAACRHTPPPTLIQIDAGPQDGGPPPTLDSDGDGLCDVTEFQRRTSAYDADTDGDGFSDWVEAQNGSDALSLGSPVRSMMVEMSDTPMATLDVPLSFTVRGIGETFGGELTRLPLYYDDDMTEASTFYAGTTALGATPMENVHGGIMGSQFFGVLGRTLLTFSVHFQQTQPARRCMRAFPFGFLVKTEAGSVRATLTRWLVIVPPGMSIGATGARWCGPSTDTCD